MIPIVAFVGPSGSGKTTLVEKIIGELVAARVRVATIKHHLKELDVDKEGKDSWRHKRAGAGAVAIVAPAGVAVIRSEDREPDPGEVVERYLYDADVVLAEGYKAGALPSVVVTRKEAGELNLSEVKKPVAVVADYDVDAGDLPKFSLDDYAALAKFIKANYVDENPTRRVNMFVDGKVVPMKHFVRDMLERVVRALVDSLRGTKGAKKINIYIDGP